MKTKKYKLHLKGYVGSWDFDQDYVDDILAAYPDETVEVLIDSSGGSAIAALRISAAFGRHGNVKVHYSGVNASAATIASMGASHVSIDRNAIYLVHNCRLVVSVWKTMTSEELDKFLEDCGKQKENLKQLDRVIAGIYARRCKKTSEELATLMAEERWLTAEEALEWGFVDEITDYAEDAPAKVDSRMIEDLIVAGIPLPPSCEQPPVNALHAAGVRLADKVDDIVDGIRTRIDNLFNNQKSEKMDKTTEEPVADSTTQAKEPAKEPATASVESDEVAALKASLAEAERRAAEAEARVEELEKKPEPVKGNVVTSPGAKSPEAVTPEAEFVADMQGARELYDSLP